VDYFTVKNWDKFQHYKDRLPPWIKLHRELLNNYEFTCLQDASKLHLMLIWLLASQTDNKLPADPQWLKNALHIDIEPDLEALFNAGFIEIDSDLLAACKQVDIVETEAEAYKQETETDLPEKLKFSMPDKFFLNVTNHKYIEQVPDSIARSIIDDFVDYWKIEGSKKTETGWQQAFRRNPIVKKKITNYLHNQGNQNGNEENRKLSAAERASKQVRDFDEHTRKKHENNSEGMAADGDMLRPPLD